MRSNFEKSEFIKILGKTPFVSYAAQKVGIARATIYRWKENNPEFREEMEKALNSGRSHMIDVAEMALIEKIKDKDMAAIKFFLQHNEKRYRPIKAGSASPEPVKKLSDEEAFIYESFSQLSNEQLERQINDLKEGIKKKKKKSENEDNQDS